jgi:hypothetical protein
LISTPHARVHAPGRIGTVDGDDGPQKPGVVADNSCHGDASVRPVDNIPHVLGQALGIEVFARSLHGAISIEGGAREALEVQLDEQLRCGEEKIGEQ